MSSNEMATPDPPAGGNPPEPAARPTVVGIGASAGGLNALREFFSHVPERSGVVFVVVVHLNPEHESHLADLLQPHVRMPVQQVTETVPLETDRVYVIPPGAHLNSVDTHLRLSRLEDRQHGRAPIDHFFRTLAATHDGHAVGVILTGTGSDGALGVKAIKELNGFALVQDPGEAEYDGMPRSAIATGLVDAVLPVGQLAAAVLDLARTTPRVPVPADGEDVEGEHRLLLQKVFAQVRARTGRDFSRYKRSTLLRRIHRRMQLRRVDELAAYLELLRQDPEEVRTLADDILITVTNFFRDAETWQQLEAEIVPALFAGRTERDSIRAWSVGCATGEEAYSLAILLLEEAARRDAAPQVQVFASDLHEASLDRAREGFYPGDIEADVSPERLRRFFHKEDGGYRVRKEVREKVVFAPHNLLGDPPFSRLDLISCRNLMIYLQRDVQRDIIELFHYALRPEGVLVLGTSETVEGSELFRTESKRHCIFRKRNVPGPEPRLPVFPMSRARAIGEAKPMPEHEVPVAYGTLHRRLLEQHAPPSMLVSPDGRVAHFSGGAGRYLLIPAGEPTTSAFKLVREELRIDLRSALHTAREKGMPTRSRPIPVQFNGDRGWVVLDVRPAVEPDHQGFALVIFDERGVVEVDRPAGADPARARHDRRITELEAELDLTKQRLQAVIEEYESSQEEMKASHEELQSANEELRSTLEELETSKEELQSMNEELQTVNQENRHKVEELSQLSSDLQNLLTSTDIATLFLDRDLRILRFTPQVGELFNIRPVDKGRPLTDLTHHLGYAELHSDAQAVLRKLIPVEREVSDESGRWYLTRVLPYRDANDRIEGVVVTFIDITERVKAEQSLRQLNETLEERVAERTRELSRAHEALQLHHTLLSIAMEATDAGWGTWEWPSGRAQWSEHGKRLMGFESEEEATTTEGWLRHVHPEDRARVKAEAAAAAEERRDFRLEYRIVRPGGEVRHVLGRGRVLHGEQGGPARSTGLVVDITERRRAEEMRTELLRQLVTAEEDERRRLSLELHDQMGQQLTGLLLGLRAAREAAAAHDEVERLRELEHLTSRIAQDVQHLALELRPPALDSLGLAAALQAHLEEWCERYGLQYDFHAVGLDGDRFAPEAETTIYRAVQEALTNVLKHADASRVSLVLERRNGILSAILEDDGAGFDVEEVLATTQRSHRLGLRGIRERVSLLGGDVDIESSPAAGTTVFVRIPDREPIPAQPTEGAH